MRTQQAKPSRGTRVWTALSCIVSVGILVWVLSLPFRRSVVAMAPQQEAEAAETLDLVEQRKQRQWEAENYREAAIAMDEDLMHSLARKRKQELRQPRPGIVEAREHREAYKRRIRRDIEQLGRPKEKSPQWYYQRYLLENLRSNDDGPPS